MPFVFMPTIRFKFSFNEPDQYGDVYAPNAFAQKQKIKIAPGQAINTAVFEEAIVLEENGKLTKEGLKELMPWCTEVDLKPIIDFINRL